jgi:hypothetical protein
MRIDGRVDDEPVGAVAVEDLDVAGAEEPVHREPAPVWDIGCRVGDVRRRCRGDVDRGERGDAVARLQVGEDDRALRNLGAQNGEQPRRQRM